MYTGPYFRACMATATAIAPRSALSGIPSSERAGEGAILVPHSHHLVTRRAEFTDEGSRISLTRLGYTKDHDHVRLLGPGAEDREML